MLGFKVRSRFDGNAMMFGRTAEFAAAAREDAGSPKPATTQEQGVEAPRVLIVEDHRDTAAMLSSLVEAWGFQPAIAETGEEARRIAAEFHPRVVLLDLALP